MGNNKKSEKGSAGVPKITPRFEDLSGGYTGFSIWLNSQVRFIIPKGCKVKPAKEKGA